MCSYVDIIGGQFVFFDRVRHILGEVNTEKCTRCAQDRTKNSQTIAPIDNEPNKQDKEW